MRKSTRWRLPVVSGGGRQLQAFIASRQTSKTRSISAGSTKVSKASFARPLDALADVDTDLGVIEELCDDPRECRPRRPRP